MSPTPSNDRGAHRRGKAMFVAGLVVGAALLWLAVRNVDASAIGASLLRADWKSVPVFLVVLFLYYWLKAERWKRLLLPIKRIETRRLFPPLMIGYAMSSILPMHLGELARVYLVRTEQSVRASALLMSIAVERLLDLVTIPVLFAVAMLGGKALPPAVVNAGYVVGLIGVCGIAFVAVLVARPALVLGLIRRVAAPLPSRLRDAIVAQIEASADGAAALRSVAGMSSIVALTLLQWTMMGACIWLAIRAVGTSPPWPAAVLTVAMINVAVALPTSPGYIGSVQAAFVLALLPFGASNEAAVTASIFFHVLAYASVVLVGFAFLLKMGLTPNALAKLRASG
ncbi:MAG: lysylphosphatidylglycerol synthase transmembrane domain-containing protein [Gammaproteobacteria bacterium]